MMGARPQAVGYGLTDSPAGLAGLMLVHGGFGKWTYGKDPNQSPTKDEVLDDFTLYWLTNTATSAARLYWENREREPDQRGRAEDRRDHGPGGHHGVSERGPTRPGDVGPARLPQPDLLQRGAATSRPGKCPTSSRRRSEPRSGRFASRPCFVKGDPHELIHHREFGTLLERFAK